MQKKCRIAFFDAKPYDRVFFDAANERSGGYFDIAFFETRLTPRSAPMAEHYDVVCAFVNDDLSASTVKLLGKYHIKLIAMRCAGYNNVSLKTAHELGIRVVRVPEYSPHAVAEYTLGLLLTLNRKIHRAFNRVRENNFSINGLLGFDLYGKTVGIVGTGKIGRTFAQIIGGLGVKLLAYDPYPHPEAESLKLHYVSMPELLAQSDIISLHCPLTPDNKHLICKETIKQMKRGVMLLNTSRGKLIDSAALIGALKSGMIGGAGLDVYEEETDYFFEDCSDSAVSDDTLARLMTFPNVIITSHQAFFTREALTNIAGITLRNISDFLNGEELKNEICFRCGHSEAKKMKRP